MASESRSDRYERVHDRLRLAARWRTDEGYDNKWRRLIDVYRGKTYWNASNANFSGNVTDDRIAHTRHLPEEPE